MKKKYFHATIVLLVLFASNLHAQDTVSWGYYRYLFPPLRCKFHLFNRDNSGLIPRAFPQHTFTWQHMLQSHLSEHIFPKSLSPFMVQPLPCIMSPT